MQDDNLNQDEMDQQLKQFYSDDNEEDEPNQQLEVVGADIQTFRNK